MSASINLNTALQPFVIITNVGVNSLTQLYYSKLNPQWNALQKTRSAATVHYNVKATLYNLATAYLALRILKTLTGRSSPSSSMVIVPTLLFMRLVVDRSMSAESGAKAVLKGAWKSITDDETLDGVSFFDNGYASICIAASNLQNKASNTSWKENMLIVQGYPVLKNWSFTLF